MSAVIRSLPPIAAYPAPIRRVIAALGPLPLYQQHRAAELVARFIELCPAPADDPDAPGRQVRPRLRLVRH